MHSFPEVISCKIASWIETLYLLPFLHVGHCLPWISAGHVYVVTVSELISASALVCLEYTLFWSCSPLSGFIVFTFLFWNTSLSLEWGGCGRLATCDLELSTSESFTLHIVLLWVIILCTVCQRVPIELLLEHLKLLPLLLDFLYNFIIRPFCWRHCKK